MDSQTAWRVARSYTDDSEYALPTLVAPDPERGAYRQILKGQIRQRFEEEGIIPIVDWIKEVDQNLPQLIRDFGGVRNIDVLIEELRNFFYEKYPPFPQERRWRHRVRS